MNGTSDEHQEKVDRFNRRMATFDKLIGNDNERSWVRAYLAIEVFIAVILLVVLFGIYMANQ